MSPFDILQIKGFLNLTACLQWHDQITPFQLVVIIIIIILLLLQNHLKAPAAVDTWSYRNYKHKQINLIYAEKWCCFKLGSVYSE